MRTCPISNTPLTHQTVHGVEVDRGEHGVWLDRGELFAITEAVRQELGDTERALLQLRQFFTPNERPEDRGDGQGQRDLACPSCGNPMIMDTYADVHIDRCPSHGVWLDANELDLIIEHLKADPAFLRGVRIRFEDAQL